MKLLTRDKVKLGLIGLENIGSRIARRLLNDAYHLIAYDWDHSKAAVLSPEGAVVADSIVELSQSTDVILSCLTNEEAVQSVYFGHSGVLANARPGTVVLEMSTVFPRSSRELCRRCADRGIPALDVAISGSALAEQGALNLLVGGDEELFLCAQPLFRAISARSFHVGPAGAGTTMKLVVNRLLGVGTQAIAEAIPVGERAGIQRNRLLEVLSQAAVIAPDQAGKFMRAAEEGHSPQFSLPLTNENFCFMPDRAGSRDVQMPTTIAEVRVNSTEWAGNPDADFSAVIRRWEELGRLEAS
jgi:3-hydroxyisobutyrate dehydrogenase-like beta-hydroxyacid dehydrogenase